MDPGLHETSPSVGHSLSVSKYQIDNYDLKQKFESKYTTANQIIISKFQRSNFIHPRITFLKSIDSSQAAAVYKLVLIGDSNTGKTSILLRYTTDSFPKIHNCTLGVDFKTKNIKID